MARVLVLDDDSVFRKAARIVLTRAGHEVSDTENGRDALAAVVRDGVDLIVLDLKMPAMAGTTFLQVLRSYVRWRTLPVIVVTANVADGDLDRARGFGFQCAYDKTTLELDDLAACANHLIAAGQPACCAPGQCGNIEIHVDKKQT